MKQIRKRLTYANVMSSLAVFMVLGGGAAVASNHILPKNSVGTPQLKKNAVTTAKIKANAVTGAKVNEATLGPVRSANTANHASTAGTANTANHASTAGTANTANHASTAGTANTANHASTAGTANNLVGQTTFAVRLNFGQTQTIAAHGAVSLEAACAREGGTDYARILYQTSVNGAVAEGDDSWSGGANPSDFLNVGLAPSERELIENSTAAGGINVESDIDEGFVLGPDGKGLVVNSEGIILGLNYGAPGCYIAGVANAIG